MRRTLRTCNCALAVLATANVTVGSGEREITVEVEGTTLKGTLVIPDSIGPHPAALIVAASGPHPRDEARTGGTHWADLAQVLAKNGVASLRLDSRSARAEQRTDGAPDDPNDYQWTPHELAADSSAALSLLMNLSEVDRDRTGLIAFSDGTSRAAMIAAQRPEDVSFCVLLSPSGVAPLEDVLAQQVNQARSMGLDEEQVAVVESRGRRALSMITAGEDQDETLQAVGELLEALGLPEEQRSSLAPRIVKNFSSRGARALLGHDPASDLDAIMCPTLAVNGGADSRLVSPKSRRAILEAFEFDTTDKLSAVTLGGLGHFLEPITGDEESRTFDGAVTSTIIAWLETHGFAR